MFAFPEADLDTIERLDALAVRLDGDLARPGDPEWDVARLAWQLSVDQHPAAVVHAASVDDVILTVDAARELGLRVAPQGTGHNAAPLGRLDGTILLKTSGMRGVTIDPVRRVARAEAGALWMDVVPTAYEHGLTALAGSSPDVGVVGYTVGGGISWHARSLGLASSNVVAVEIVTADGTWRRVDDDHEPELFWAIRGGGGSFGVVTAVEIRLFEFTEVQAGILFFPLERAAEVLHAWRSWVETVPDEVMSVGRMLRFPPIPDLPPFLSGQSFVVVEAVMRMEAADADRLLAPLRALGPAIDTIHPTPTSELGQLHMDPPGPVPGAGDGMLLTGLPAEAVDAVLSASGPGVDSPLLSVEFRHLGGALAPGASTGGAVTGFDAEFAMFAVGFTPTPASHAAVNRAVDGVQHALAPWSTGRVYLNFAERVKAGTALFEDDTYRRLQQVKATYDPSDVIRSNHPIALP
ncbi:MAG TPA: FAD-binding oxidoreductase [Kineosporiaceae bacterium]|nr:FAD-binding oxidoreductase [Kineosporiaceae bacterium]